MGNGTLANRMGTGMFYAVCGALGMWTAYMIVDREPPVVVYQARVQNDVVPRDGQLRVTYLLRRQRSCSTEVNRFIYDSDNIRHPLDDFKSNPGQRLGEEEYTVATRIAPEVSTGPARYQTIANYYCNPLQRVLQWPIIGDIREIKFTVR